MDKIKILFEQTSTHHLQISSGSTGKLYAQIKNGAPFDIFLAADKARPLLLMQEGLAEGAQSYADGRLVLWSGNVALKNKTAEECLQSFKAMNFSRLAIANPKTAPYGLAAETFLQKNNLWSAVQSKLVRGENIGQVLQFSRSGAVDFSLLALAQLQDKKAPVASCTYTVPQDQHEPIEQYAVIIKNTAQKKAAEEFLLFLKSDKIKQLIRSQGYMSID
jgi:molybdate transport system substrate-binding protein